MEQDNLDKNYRQSENQKQEDSFEAEKKVEKNPTKKKRNFILIIVLVFILLGIGGGIYFLPINFGSKRLDPKLRQAKEILKKDAYKDDNTARLTGLYLGCRVASDGNYSEEMCSMGTLSEYRSGFIVDRCRVTSMFFEGFWNKVVRTNSCDSDYVETCATYFRDTDYEEAYKNCEKLCNYYLEGKKEACSNLEDFSVLAKTTCEFYINPSVSECDGNLDSEVCSNFVTFVNAIQQKPGVRCSSVDLKRERLACRLYFNRDKKACEEVYKNLLNSLPNFKGGR